MFDGLIGLQTFANDMKSILAQLPMDADDLQTTTREVRERQAKLYFENAVGEEETRHKYAEELDAKMRDVSKAIIRQNKKDAEVECTKHLENLTHPQWPQKFDAYMRETIGPDDV